jgi:mannose-6-phosphate isomerase-like protein (cupin superfamily)
MTTSVTLFRRDEGQKLNVLGVGDPSDEAYYVLEGEVEFQVGTHRQQVRAGDFLYAPSNTVHAFRGLSEKPARMVVFDAPAHAEAFFKELDHRALQMPRDLSQLPEIAARHGLQVL